MVRVIENIKSERSVEVSFGELTEVAVPPSAQALMRQLEDLTGRFQARSLLQHHFLMGFEACDDLVHGGVISLVYFIVFIGPIITKFIVLTGITFLKRLISDITGVS